MMHEVQSTNPAALTDDELAGLIAAGFRGEVTDETYLAAVEEYEARQLGQATHADA